MFAQQVVEQSCFWVIGFLWLMSPPPFTFEGISALSHPPLFTLQNRSSFVLSYGRGIPHVPNYNNPPRHESGRVLLSPPFHMARPSHLKLGRAGVPLARTLRRLQLMQIFFPRSHLLDVRQRDSERCAGESRPLRVSMRGQSLSSFFLTPREVRCF